jgi:hypothetical protein
VRWSHSVSLCLKMNVFKDIHNLSRLNTVMSDFLGYEHWVTCHVVWGHARCYNIQIDAWPFPYQTSYHPGEPHIDIRQQITCQADIIKWCENMGCVDMGCIGSSAWVDMYHSLLDLLYIWGPPNGSLWSGLSPPKYQNSIWTEASLRFGPYNILGWQVGSSASLQSIWYFGDDTPVHKLLYGP